MVKLALLVVVCPIAAFMLTWLALQASDARIRARNARGHLTGHSGCFRCGDTWDWKPSHTTEFSPSEGCFPLCEDCWAALEPETRWPYYEQLVHAWEILDPPGSHSHLYREALGLGPVYAEKRELIRAAVMAGK